MCEVPVKVVETYAKGDREYALLEGHCKSCDSHRYFVRRLSGIYYTEFRLAENFRREDFRNFCDDVDEDLFQSAPTLLERFHDELLKVNEPHGIQADGTFTLRLLEYGRTRLICLQRLNAFDGLLDKIGPPERADAALRAAFELGFAAGKYDVENLTEELYWEGFLAREAREQGQARAKAALKSKGQQTRTAIKNAAERLYQQEPDLIRNDTATARMMLERGMVEVQNNGQPLRIDTICKYLRRARQGREQEKSNENPNSGNPTRKSGT